MDRAEAMAEAIKNMEPALRIKGCVPDFNKFNSQFNAGYFSEATLVEMAIDNSKADVVDSTND